MEATVKVTSANMFEVGNTISIGHGWPRWMYTLRLPMWARRTLRSILRKGKRWGDEGPYVITKVVNSTTLILNDQEWPEPQ